MRLKTILSILALIISFNCTSVSCDTANEVISCNDSTQVDSVKSKEKPIVEEKKDVENISESPNTSQTLSNLLLRLGFVLIGFVISILIVILLNMLFSLLFYIGYDIWKSIKSKKVK